jgi:hypothetical protein
MGARFRFREIANNPNLPYVNRASDLNTIPAVIAAWTMRNRGDSVPAPAQTGHNIQGEDPIFNEFGLVWGGGASGLFSNLVLPLSHTIGIAAYIDPTAAGNGNFVSCQHTATNSGTSIEYLNASPSVRGNGLTAAGATEVTSAVGRAKGTWFIAVCSFSGVQFRMTMGNGALVSSPGGITRNAPTQQLLFFDGYQSQKGMDGIIGAAFCCNSALNDSDALGAVGKLHNVMLEKGISISA